AWREMAEGVAPGGWTPPRSCQLSPQLKPTESCAHPACLSDTAVGATLAPRTSVLSMDGGAARSLVAWAMSALAIGPLRWACGPASSPNASNTPNVDGPRRSANHSAVVAS